MEFQKEHYKKEFERLLNSSTETKAFIRHSTAAFKIGKFMRKGIDSLELANFIANSDQPAKNYWIITICYYSMLYSAKAAIIEKGYETDDHYSTQIALGHLLVPNEMQREDLELLDQAHRIFEDEYIDYFEDARKESSVSRYSATKVYAQKRVKEILANAKDFLTKITQIIDY